MKLYYSPLSTYSQKALIAFNEKGIAYEPQLVDLFSPEGRAAFDKISPLGKVPFLEPSDDWSVPESTSIIEYLEDRFPDTPRLIAIGAGDAPRLVRFYDRMADLYINEPIAELLFQKIGFRPKDEAKEARMRKVATLSFENCDKLLANRTWLAGDRFSMADCATIPPLFYARVALPFDAYPNLSAYWERAQQRPSYVKVRAEFEPIWNALMK